MTQKKLLALEFHQKDLLANALKDQSIDFFKKHESWITELGQNDRDSLLLDLSNLVISGENKQAKQNEEARILCISEYLIATCNVDINARGWLNRSPLHFASMKNNFSLVKLLLSQKKIAIYAQDILGDTAFHRAAKHGDRHLIDLFLEKGIDINILNNELKSPLLRMVSISPIAQRSDVLNDNIAYLIKKGASTTLKDVYGNTMDDYNKMKKADIKPATEVPDAGIRKSWVFKNDMNAFKAFFQCHPEAVMDTVTYLGDTLLSTTALFGRTDMLKYLLSLPNVNINHKNEEDKQPLFWAVDQSNMVTAEYLLSNDSIELNSKERVFGETVLHRAVINRHLPMTQRLLEKGADVGVQNHFGQTALHLSVSSPVMDHDILDVLLSYLEDKSLNLVDQHGRTAVHVAAENGHHLAVKVLLKHGADPKVKAKTNKDAMEVMPDIERYLKEKEILDGRIEQIEEAMEALSKKPEDVSVYEDSILNMLKLLALDAKDISLDKTLRYYHLSIMNKECQKLYCSVLCQLSSLDVYLKQSILQRLQTMADGSNSTIRGKMNRDSDRVKKAASIDIEEKIKGFEFFPKHSTDSNNYKTQRNTNDPCYVLSIDGGGIRGIIPAMALCKIEQRTKKSISSLFDVLAGTSTGGILTAGISTPGGDSHTPKYAAYDLLDLYTRRGNEIFPKKSFFQKLFIPRWQAFSVKYSADSLEKIAQDYFGNRKLSQSLTDLMITTYDTVKKEPYFFHRADARSDAKNDVLMKDSVRATSAAPTYLPPKKIGDKVCVDGGVVINNPAEKIVTWLERQGKRPEDLRVVSLGTGEPREAMPISEKIIFRGQLFWASTIPDLMMNGASYLVHDQLSDMFRPHPNHYFRIQAQLDYPIKLDGVNNENIQTLIDSGNKMLDENSDQINTIIEMFAD